MKNQVWFLVLTPIFFCCACTARSSDGLVDGHIRSLIPEGAGPFPALIAIPGCSGIAFESDEMENAHPELTEDDRAFRRHYITMAERLRSEGFAVLLVDVLAAEGRVTACGDNVPSQRIAAYIDAAVAWTLDAPFADGERISLIGWSMGGWGTLAWLARQDNGTTAVHSAALVYPDCMGIEPLTAEIPVLMLLGGADDITPPIVCQDLVYASGAKESIVVRQYPGARHGFDVSGLPEFLELADGISVGYQEAAASAAWEELMDFL